jgi:hypothetical protein
MNTTHSKPTAHNTKWLRCINIKKVTTGPMQARKAWWGCASTAPLTLNLGVEWALAAISTPRSLYPQEKWIGCRKIPESGYTLLTPPGTELQFVSHSVRSLVTMQTALTFRVTNPLDCSTVTTKQEHKICFYVGIPTVNKTKFPSKFSYKKTVY